MKRNPGKKYYRDEKMLIKIGKHLRKLRIGMSLSQKMLANKMDIDCSQVKRTELGQVNFRVSYLCRLAKALEIDPARLLP